MMKIDLTDLRSEDALYDPTDTRAMAGYVHVLPNGAWHAFRVSTGFEKSGDGSLQSLEPGLWVSNLPFVETEKICKALPGILLRSEGWLKLTSDNILASWGMTGVNGRTAARLMASIVHRACALVLESVADWDETPAMRRRAATLLGTRPSLATAIAGILEKDLFGNRSVDVAVESMMTKTYQQGMFCYGRKVAPQGFLNLSFHFPRLSHALAMTRDRIPDGGSWKVGPRGQGVSSEQFYQAASRIEEPLIFYANPYVSNSITEYMEAFTGARREQGRFRCLFTRDEYDLIRRETGDTVQSVYVGNGWSRSTIGRFLEVFMGVCGGRHVAAYSFTANLVAENIFAAAFRKPNRDTGSEAPETIWLGARDRIELYKVTQEFYQFGATLVSAQHGVVQIQCPKDPELLSGILETSWRHALTLPMDRVAEISPLGVDIPHDRASFGGNPVDYAFCAIAQTGKKKSLFILDEILDADRADRSDRMRALLS